ncbi:MAG: hypothetical protein MJA84_13910 [Firmicutes bacterium]|nr:hypothetical protein [Bacillota bacterium]
MTSMHDHADSRLLRERRATRSAAAGVAFQAVYVIGQFVVMALLYRELGAERFGMWLTIFSLTAWVALSKFGLQYAVYTALGQTALTDREEAQRVLSNAAVFVALVCFFIAALMTAVGPWFPWPAMLNVSGEQAVREASTVSVVALVIAAFSMPMLMGGHAMQACQRGDISQTLAMLMQVVMIAGVAFGVWNDWPLAALAAVIVGPPLIAGLLQWGFGLRARILPALSLRVVRVATLRRLLAAGILFLALDLAMLVLLQSAPLLLVQLQSPEAVVPYGAAYRLVGLLIAAFMMVSYAYWPAYSEAEQRNDTAWVRKGLLRTFLKTLGLWLAGAAVTLAIGRPFIRWWLGEAAMPDWPTLIAAVVFALMYGLHVMVATPLSGMGRLRPQIITAAGVIALYLLCGLPFGMWYGPAGLFTAQAIAAALGAVMNGLFLIRVLRSRQQEGVLV